MDMKFTLAAFIVLTVLIYSLTFRERSRNLNDIEYWFASLDLMPKIFDNISPPDAQRGIVVASPSHADPNYYYHWTRDAAIVLYEINHLYKVSNKSEIERIFWEYASLSRSLQKLPAIAGIGEPKFNIDGSLFNDPWCRPQTDGPALEASLLIDFSFNYLGKGGSIDKLKELYDSKLPTDSLIKTCLEYISHYWDQNTCDLWEEVVGDFFYTRIVQRSALLVGSRFARIMNDSLAADWYALQASEISLALEHHWSEADGYVVSGLHNARDIRSGLDISTILGVLHSRETPTFQVYDDRMLITLNNLVERFSQIYSINKIKDDTYGRALGPAIGRYPEDMYDGTGKSRGNPWYLATASIGEYLYKLANTYQSQGVIHVTQRSLPFFQHFLKIRNSSVGTMLGNSSNFSIVITACVTRADEFIRRIKYHSFHANLSEQFDANSGKNLGAYDLSWSYASLLSAKRARKQYSDSMKTFTRFPES